MNIYIKFLIVCFLAPSVTTLLAGEGIKSKKSKAPGIEERDSVYAMLLNKKFIEPVPVYWGRWDFAYTDATFDNNKALGKIDSGYTGRVVMDLDFAKKHHIKLREEGSIQGGAGKMKRFKGLVSSVTLANKRMNTFYKPHKIIATGLGDTSKGGELTEVRSIDLHVGVNLLREHAWLLSYEVKKAWRQKANISKILMKAGYTRVKMTKSARGLQILTLKLASQPIKVVVDTGAGASHFLPAIVTKAGLTQGRAGKISTGDGSTASAKAVIIRNVPITLSGHKVTIGSCWSSNAAKSVQRQGGDVKDVQAVVGVDLLMKLGALIDFKNDVLWLPLQKTSN